MKTLLRGVLLLLAAAVAFGLAVRWISRRRFVSCPWWLDWLLENRYMETFWWHGPVWRAVWLCWTPAAGQAG